MTPELVGLTHEQLSRELYWMLPPCAGDLYSDIPYHSYEYDQYLARLMLEIREAAMLKRVLLMAHYYMRPEIQLVCDFTGDSLGLALKTQELLGHENAPAGVWLSAVRFMGDTMKVVLGDAMHVCMPKFSGCSLVASIRDIPFNYQIHSESHISQILLKGWDRQHPVDTWLAKNPDGIVLSYMNSDSETKARSWAVFTSRNAMKVLECAMRENPGKKVFMLPDQYLSHFVLTMARAQKNPWIKPEMVEVFPGLCHVHAQKIESFALDEALVRYPNAALAVHPECGCSVSCFARVAQGKIDCQTFIGSTQEMIDFAKRPDVPNEIVVATEAGHVFTLRRNVPDKTFYPITAKAMCEFMKATTLEDLHRAILDSDQSRYEVTFSSDIITRARAAIDRMLAIR